MDLLHRSRDDHALRTAALIRRSHPSDKELQLAGLLHGIGRLLRPGDGARHAVLAAEAVRPLLGERVARLVRLHAPGAGSGRAGGADEADGQDDDADAVATLRQAHDAAAGSGLDHQAGLQDPPDRHRPGDQGQHLREPRLQGQPG
ncbi:HD domain-containing protein, partial [Streptomyces sp. NPDC041003]|uniref:HD domain-containing protein n=1 Tax=Streptomyces sp. NPDC041003 TaxID=3155730 RepID=UPI0033FE5FBA